MKLNGNNIITDNDVTMTGQHIGESLDAVLSKQEQDIDELKGNVKWIYQNGGVGGNGGNGGGSSKDWSIYAKLNNIQLKENSTVILNGSGQYQLDISINSPGGGIYLATVSYVNNNGKQTIKGINLIIDNAYKKSVTLTLNTNDTVIIEVINQDGETKQVNGQYITIPYHFDLSFIKGESGNYIPYAEDIIYIENIKRWGIKLQLKYDLSIQGIVKFKYITLDGKTQEQVQITDKTGSGEQKFEVADSTFFTEDRAGLYNLKYEIEIIPTNQEPITISDQLSCNLIPKNLYLRIKLGTGSIYDTTSIESPYEYGPGNITFYLTAFEGANLGRTYSIDTKLNGNVYGTTVICTERIPYTQVITASKDGWNTIIFTVTSSTGTKYSVTKYFYINNSDASMQYSEVFKDAQDRFYHWNNIQNNFGEEFFEKSTAIEMTSQNDPVTLQWNTEDTSSTKGTFVLNIALQLNTNIALDSPIFTIKDTSDNQNNQISVYRQKTMLGQAELNSFLPALDTLSVNENSKYTLYTIFKKLIDNDINTNTQTFELQIYVDGKLESSRLTTYNPTYDKIIFSSNNYCCNLLDIRQYTAPENAKALTVKDFEVAKYFYVYQTQKGLSNYDEFSSYKEIDTILSKGDIHLNSGANGLMVTTSPDLPGNLANVVKVPILVLNLTSTKSYEQGADGSNTNFLRWYSQVYKQEDTTQNFDVTIEYSNGISKTLQSVQFNEGTSTSVQFYIQIQGSSSKNRHAKNLELCIKSTNDESSVKPIFTPNFKYSETDPDYNTFLPETSFTLKADVVDSSHCNNNSIGAFVNDNTTKFDTGSMGKFKGYIKNSLIGFPCLVFVKETIGSSEEQKTTTYYLGVYNFNLGRNSQYNLGYLDLKQLENIGLDKNEGNFKVYQVPVDSYNTKVPGLYVAEVQDNDNYYDFSQFDQTIINGVDNKDNAKMFGDYVYGSGSTQNMLTTSLQNVVKAISKAGGYLFDCLKKNYGTPDEKYIKSLYNYTNIDSDKYYSINQVPNYRVQYKKIRQGSSIIEIQKIDEEPNATEAELISCIIGNADSNTPPIINYTSLVEYFVICMAFCMLDSVEKNINIKSWNDGKTWYIAFYDMDTALGKANAGEKVGYFAYTDYWKLISNSTTLEDAVIQRDFNPQDTTGEKLFDVPSNYLLAIAKYSSIFLKGFSDTSLAREFPLTVWAKYRKADGPLSSAKAFMDKYFTGRLKNVGLELLNLNYRSKYFVSTKGTDNKYIYISDASEFNGSGQYQVEDWLNQRLHILDVYMGLCSTSPTSRVIQYYDKSDSDYHNWKWKNLTTSGVPIVESELENGEFPSNNPDIEIYTDIFSNGQQRPSYSSDITVQLQALPKTFIIVAGSSKVNRFYIEDGNTAYTMNVPFNGTQQCTFGGSDRWTYISDLTPFIIGQENLYIHSLNLKNFRCNKLSKSSFSSYSLYLPQCQSVEVVNSPNTSITLNINNTSFPQVKTVDISGSKIEASLSNLIVTKFNGSKLNSVNLSILNCNRLADINLQDANFTGYVTIGTLPENTKINLIRLKCKELNLTGSTVISTASINGSIQTVDYLYISDNPTLTTISLKGFKKIHINNCPNLQNITINNEDLVEELYITNCASKSSTLVFNNQSEKTIDLSKFTKLKSFSLSGTQNVTNIKFPNTDTCILPGWALANTQIKTISGGKGYISSESTFRNSPLTSGLQYLYISPDCTNLSYTFCLNYSNNGYGITTNELINFFNNIPDNNNINSLYYMCGNQHNIKYTKEDYLLEYRQNRCSLNLDKFKKVTTAAYMFSRTQVTFLNKYMFKDIGINNSQKGMVNFIGIFAKYWADGNLDYEYGTYDCLQYILPKTRELSLFYMQDYSAASGLVIIDDQGNIIEQPKVSNIFNSTDYNSSNIESFYEFSICSRVEDTKNNITAITPDFTGLFESDNWSNLKSINRSFNWNITIDDISDLYLDKLKLKSIEESFLYITTPNLVNYFTLINWDYYIKNTTQSLIGSNFRYFLRYIKYDDYCTLLSLINTNKSITALGSLFANICIVGNTIIPKKDDQQIICSNINTLTSNSNDSTEFGTFTHCRLISSIENISDNTALDKATKLPLDVTKEFIKTFPNVTTWHITFKECYIKDIPELDFFSRRTKIKSDGLIKKVTEDNKVTFDKIKVVKYDYPVKNKVCDGMFLNCTFENTIFKTESNKDILKNNYLEDLDGNAIEGKEYYITSTDKEPQILEDDIYYNDMINPTVCNYNTQNYISSGVGNLNYPSLNDGDYTGYYILPPDFFAAMDYNCNCKNIFSESNLWGSLPKHLIYNMTSNGTLENFLYGTNVLPTFYGEFTFSSAKNTYIKKKRVYSFVPEKFFNQNYASSIFTFRARWPMNQVNSNIETINYYYVFLDTSFIKNISSCQNSLPIDHILGWSDETLIYRPYNIMFNTKNIVDGKCGEDGWSIFNNGFITNNLFTVDYTKIGYGLLFAEHKTRPINNIPYSIIYNKDGSIGASNVIVINWQARGIILPNTGGIKVSSNMVSCNVEATVNSVGVDNTDSYQMIKNWTPNNSIIENI